MYIGTLQYLPFGDSRQKELFPFATMVKDHDVIQAVKDRNIPALQKLLAKVGKSNKSKYFWQVFVKVWIDVQWFTIQLLTFNFSKFY